VAKTTQNDKLAELADKQARLLELEREIAQETLVPARAHADALANPELIKLISEVVVSSNGLNGDTVARALSFDKMRADLLTIVQNDITRMEKLTASS